jgi:PTS system nitrogen regulatory IIA component
VTTVTADSKDIILDRLAGQFAQVYGLDHQAVLARVTERERLGSTGFGRRIAIPHARMAGLTRPVAAFMRLESPVEFDSADGMPVDLVFGLLSPEGAGATHLHALAAISRMMRDERMREALLTAPGPEAVYGLLSNVIDRDAA